jgi:hypothetical protein
VRLVLKTVAEERRGGAEELLVDFEALLALTNEDSGEFGGWTGFQSG